MIKQSLRYFLLYTLLGSATVPAFPADSSKPSQRPDNRMSITQKTVKEIFRKPRPHWVGDGFKVFPVFADKAFTSELSPFLMFDYAAPHQFAPAFGGKRRGVGQHPHRGFETVTIAFQGEVEHRDSKGNSGVIGPGDCQWMTAARGIIHEEFHSHSFAKSGGTFEMCQLWVNLPMNYKMSEPKYQPILDKDIPKVPLKAKTEKSASDSSEKECIDGDQARKDGYARIIAGNFRGVEGPARTFTPVDLWDIIIFNTDQEFELELPEGHTTMVFVRRGGVEVEGKDLFLADVAIMNREGTKLVVRATEEDTSILVLSGAPIVGEPIAARGPFVMNTQHELMEAMRDYQRGLNGFEHF